MTAPQSCVDDAIREAMSLIVRVRDDDPKTTWRHLQHLCLCQPWLLMATVVALAAAVPDDKSMSELLAWTNGLEG